MFSTIPSFTICTTQVSITRGLWPLGLGEVPGMVDEQPVLFFLLSSSGKIAWAMLHFPSSLSLSSEKIGGHLARKSKT